jgi:uncharacterized repeat protein (TIGR01451 family)
VVTPVSNPNDPEQLASSAFMSGTQKNIDITQYLHPGLNTVTFEVTNYGIPNSTSESNPAGLMYRIEAYSKNCTDTPPPVQNQNPTVTLTANPTTINSGSSSTLSWSSTNANYCSTSWNWTTTTSGSSTVSPTYSTNYSVTCYGATGTTPATSSATVNVIPNTVQNQPTVQITADNSSVDYNGSTIVRWSSQNATSCTANYGTNGWSGSKNTSGSFNTGALTSATTYGITCSNGVGSASDAVTVSVGNQQLYPSGVLNVVPSSCVISAGQSTCTVSGATWTTSNVTSPLVVDRNTNSILSTAANRSTPMTVWVAYPQTIFDLKNGGALLDTKTAYATCASQTSWNGSVCAANIVVQNPTVTLTANPTNILSGQSATLSWSAQNATSCYAPWTSSSATSGSATVSPVGTTTYNVTCVNSNGVQATASAIVTVTQQTQTPVNGGWSEWTPQNTQCGYSGVQVRTCTNPSPANGGANCSGPSTQAYTNAQCVYNGGGDNTNTNTNNNSSNNSSTNTNTNIINFPSYPPAPTYPTYQPPVYQPPIVYPTYPTYPTYQPPITYPVANNQPTVGISADRETVSPNESTFIRWYTNNATSCVASGGSIGWAGVKDIGPGSFYTGSLSDTRTYTITCSNGYGSASDSVTVSVRRSTVIYNNNPVPQSSLVLITSSVDRNQPIVPSIDNTRPHPGDEINYTVSYQNVGTASITNLTLQIPLPQEVDYIFSTPSNPSVFGNNVTFNLGTLRANGQGTVTVRVRVRDNIPAGTNLNFPAVLSYVNPSGQTQTVNANVSAQIWSGSGVNNDQNLPLGASVFGSGLFLPNNLFGWMLLIVLILVLLLLAKYLFTPQDDNRYLLAAAPMHQPQPTLYQPQPMQQYQPQYYSQAPIYQAQPMPMPMPQPQSQPAQHQHTDSSGTSSH